MSEKSGYFNVHKYESIDGKFDVEKATADAGKWLRLKSGWG